MSILLSVKLISWNILQLLKFKHDNLIDICTKAFIFYPHILDILTIKLFSSSRFKPIWILEKLYS